MPFHADFHCHLGGSTPLHVIERHAGLSARVHLESEARFSLEAGSLDGFLGRYFSFIEHLQSDLSFIEDSARGAMASFVGQFDLDVRGVFELRFCPFARNPPVLEQIHAVNRGLARATADSNFRFAARTIIIAQRGRLDHLQGLADEDYWPYINGVDVAGPENSVELLMPEWLPRLAEVYAIVVSAGLQTTYHSGEVHLQDTLALLRSDVPLTRMGHGVVLRHLEPGVLERVLHNRKDMVFELCPAVNHRTGSATMGEVVSFATTLRRLGSPFVFGSDNPVIIGTSYTAQLEGIPDFLIQSSHAQAL